LMIRYTACFYQKQVGCLSNNQKLVKWIFPEMRVEERREKEIR